MPRQLTIEGTGIKLQDSVKYLGVTLDRKLNWQEHISNKIDSAVKQLMAITSIIRDNCGPKSILMKWAYTAIVRPALTYACVNWGHEIHSKQILEKLNRIDRIALLTITRVQKSTPTAGLCILYDVMPLKTLIEMNGVKSYLRQIDRFELRWTGKGKGKRHCTSHRKYWQQKLIDINFQNTKTDLISIPNWASRYTICKESFSGERKYLNHQEINVYTDGSKLDNQVGIGIAIYKKDKLVKTISKALPNQATVFQAEICAIGTAAEELDKMKLEETRDGIKFFVDSQAALLALQSDTITSTTVEQAIKKLNNLGIKHKITLNWVKAHVGLEGNEKADQLAKEGSKSNQTMVIDTPLSHLKNEIKQNFYKRWDSEWKDAKIARQTKQFFGETDRAKSRELLELNRYDLGIAIRIISGHKNLL